MSRLPITGSDDNTWGDVLNDYLAVSHNSDGTQKYTPFQVLTNSSSVSWDCGNDKFPQAKLTSTQSFTIGLSNVLDGSNGILKLITGTASAITITFDTNFTNKRVGSTGFENITTYTFQAGNSRQYSLSFFVDGTTIYWFINEGSEWLDWVVTWTGFSTPPSSVVSRYSLASNGKTCSFYITPGGGGTGTSSGASSTMTVTLPFAAANSTQQFIIGRGIDGGVGVVALLRTRTGSNIADVFNGVLANTWGSGNKGLQISGSYEIA